MKNLKKIIPLLLSMVMLVTMVSGCGQKIDPPESVVQAYYDFIVYGDSSKIEELALSKDEVNIIKEKMDTQVKNTIKSSFDIGGLPITDEQLDNIIKAQNEAKKKLNGKVEKISEDKKTATVKITTNYLNITDLDLQAGKDAIEELKTMNITDRNTAMSKVSELYINKLIDVFNKAQPSTETSEISVKLNLERVKSKGKKVNMWVPENPVTFGIEIGTTIYK